MGAALAVGRHHLGQTWPNPAVGAVVARFDRLSEHGNPLILGHGATAAGGRPHAEPQALAQAGEAARGATLYVTLEPCSHHGRTPPCVDAVRAAGIARVVAAIGDPDDRVAGRGFSILREAGIEVTVGPGADEARLAHAGHISRVVRGRPHVMLKLAVSADGKAGLEGRRPAAITGEQARARVHMMRATHDAVLTGIGTVLADDPDLTCRLPGMDRRSPVRVVLDSQLRLPATARLLANLDVAPVWVIAGEGPPAVAERALTERGVEVMRVGATPDGGLDLEAALRLLAARGITRAMVEAGPRLASAFFTAGLVDEASLFEAPGLLGRNAVDALEGLALDAFDAYLTTVETERHGPDRLRILRRR
ncbi:bifunctional diaminohydroxyphosphoribosylaminopyrimidine deaminase/5-amino-6-(5-phosphoribosylamino)uracil reductase RibD [Ancylobacter sonchi]|uniref:bifunctional diaminohydroxyphosphoribosylaminopyrimidine deaminase/5-amino-6-(5-phosphoribosylamino)uracil reductase RibD n=1 Tax=Ancylobacter sonchi TaxID=1937790 RepID=UPI001BD28289|nr:bifunctional diaminohydroxyphosphoribosylaminopyrimidine deaminase/5-amino-6-(5-phosphoribosylamino)uracil reductase RibD [Ancylobacter sonchi]MBS7536210.1 bifunctional diaminohydroxyphosphoribosylaminopyrimidine deaminase/5-amino-6-(5-phosphoribosylamino)uracil reductase RibD [Ancylobacter sonchi]